MAYASPTVYPLFTVGVFLLLGKLLSFPFGMSPSPFPLFYSFTSKAGFASWEGSSVSWRSSPKSYELLTKGLLQRSTTLMSVWLCMNVRKLAVKTVTVLGMCLSHYYKSHMT